MATTTTTPAARPTTREESGATMRRGVGTAIRYALMILVGLILFAPFILSFFGSFKTNAEITAYPPRFFPDVWQVQNWPRLFTTDVGGEARLDGAASLGLMTGLFTAFLTFLLTG